MCEAHLIVTTSHNAVDQAESVDGTKMFTVALNAFMSMNCTVTVTVQFACRSRGIQSFHLYFVCATVRSASMLSP